MTALSTELPRTFVALALVALLGAAYGRGVTSARRAGLAGSLPLWRAAVYGGGLLALFAALSGPVEAAGDHWLIAVMAQQQALALVAAPLLLLGAPFWAFTLALPSGLRRGALREDGAAHRLGRALGRLLGPIPALLLFFAATTIWYAPPLFATLLGSGGLRVVQQASVLVAALLFWAQVVPTRPLHPRLGYVLRAVYLGAAGMYSSLMGAFFMFAVGPFYTHYATLARSAGTASAVVDQHLAGAVLDVPGTGVFFLAMSALIYLWLREDEREGAALAAEAAALRG
jgi:putative membrane protein